VRGINAFKPLPQELVGKTIKLVTPDPIKQKRLNEAYTGTIRLQVSKDQEVYAAAVYAATDYCGEGFTVRQNASAFTKEIVTTNVSSAEEVSGTSGSNEGSQDNEESQDNEDSQDDENSQEEESQDDEKSEPSVSSTQSVRRTSTGLNTTELSEKSSDEVSEQSVKTQEISEASELSEASQEISEESIRYVEGYGEVVSKEGNVALVKKDEKLFFLIPVEVESQVTLGEQGEVIDSKTSFFNWILSVFSF